MKWIETSVRRPIGVAMIVIAAMVVGFVSLGKLAIDLYPEINAPVAIVATSYPGAAPEDIEKLVVKPLEGSLGTVEGLKNISSQSSIGSSVIILEFDWGTNIDSKMLDIRDKIDGIRPFLPEDANEPSVLKFDLQAMPIMRLSVSGIEDPVRLTQITEDIIQPRLERTSGVANVSLMGTRQKEVLVEVDPNKLQAYHLSLVQISQILSGENLSITAGNLEKGEQTLLLRINGEFKSVEDIRQVRIPTPLGNSIQLGDLANIEERLIDESHITRVNGMSSLSIDISKKSDGNTVQIAKSIHKSLEQIKKLLPEGVQIDLVYDLSIFVQQSIDSVSSNMIAGGLLAALILYLFLRNFRSTFVIALAMPISIITTFTLLFFWGETLNLLTMGGLALGIGMMVDSAIVILENIFKFREQGSEPKEAAIEGSKEVGSAVIASALTTIAVFLPIAFVGGLAAELFRPLALTVSFSLFASLIVALTLVPMLSSILLKNVQPLSQMKIPNGIGKLSYSVAMWLDRLGEKYKSLIRWALNRRKRVLIISFLLVIASLFLVPFIGTEFIPGFDQGEINIDIKLPWGTLLEETNHVIDDLVNKVNEIPEVVTIFSTAGGGGTFSGDQINSHTGNLYVRLAPLGERKRTTNEVIEEIRGMINDYPDTEIVISDIQSGGFGGGSAIQIKLIGTELEVLEDLSVTISEIVKSVPGTRNVTTSSEQSNPELQVVIDRGRADQYGVTLAQVMNEVKAAVQGQTATRYRIDGEEIDVRITYPEVFTNDLSKVRSLPVQAQDGSYIPLSTVAEIIDEQSPTRINRENQSRIITVTADLADRDLGSVSNEIQAKLGNLTFPEGYTYSMGGEIQEMVDAFSDLTLALLLAIFLVYMVMAVQFEAITYPFIVMFSMPATIVGVILGLFITGRSFSVPAFIGVVMLAGIVVNNAIVLVDYVNVLRARGVDRTEALIEGGARRLRPILMTTLTTILGLLPLTLGIGEGSEAQAPLATVVVFGLTTSTLITLILIPVVYTFIDDLEQRIRSIGSRRKRAKKLDMEESSAV